MTITTTIKISYLTTIWTLHIDAFNALSKFTHINFLSIWKPQINPFNNN